MCVILDIRDLCAADYYQSLIVKECVTCEGAITYSILITVLLVVFLLIVIKWYFVKNKSDKMMTNLVKLVISTYHGDIYISC